MQFRFKGLLDAMTGLSHGERQRVILCENSLYAAIGAIGERGILDTKLCVTRLRQTVHALLMMTHEQRLHKLTRLASSKINSVLRRMQSLRGGVNSELRKTIEAVVETDVSPDLLRHTDNTMCIQRLVELRLIEQIITRGITRRTTSLTGPLTPEKRAEIAKNQAYRREKDALQRRAKQAQHARYGKERAYETGEVRPRENGVRYVGQIPNVW